MTARRSCIDPLRSAAIIAGMSLALAGCSSDLKRSLGLELTGPDPFQVVTHAPLEMPPDFGLRPPEPGAPRPNEAPVTEQARTTVFGPTAPQPTALPDRSTGESALLRQAGAIGTDPSIRDKVNRESVQLAQQDRSFVDRLVFWRDPPPPGTVVDPQAEARRLRENAALGKPVTDGNTPIIQRKKNQGLLEGLF